MGMASNPHRHPLYKRRFASTSMTAETWLQEEQDEHGHGKWEGKQACKRMSSKQLFFVAPPEYMGLAGNPHRYHVRFASMRLRSIAWN
jgi:hypothetical protein